MASVSAKTFVPEVLILCGLPASGKTTRAKKWVEEDSNRRIRINYDDLRTEAGIPAGTFNRKQEDAIQAKAIEQFEIAMRLGMSVVVDNTNLTPKARQKWQDLALAHNIEAEVQEVGSDIPIWDIIIRDNAREDRARVGRAVIERMALWNGFIDWNDKSYTDGFVICDLDGTLADISHRKHFVEGVEKKDWKSFFANVSEDKLNQSIAELLDIFYDDGYNILLVSGRPINPCGIPTQDWLTKHKVKYDHLFMRAGGDSRSDVIVKQEILDHLPKDRIDYVLDDRDSVVEMWRKNGLTCLQVAKGDF